MNWETVIGLEIHVQLATRTKIFSGASTTFGAAPNSQASAVDLAMPGTLPVLNEEAVRKAVLFGLAINAKINHRSVFERKNYYYPDLPKGYQTTQLAEPVVGAGHVDILLADGSTRSIRIHHAHLEEDAGKSLHEDFHGMTGIDLNRAGTPLLEIVTEPDLRSPEEAVAFARKLHAIITSAGIGDGDMSQGSMRFDVNVSIRPRGEQKLGTRTETKNLNSFKFMDEAIRLEVQRQIEVLEDGGCIKQETRLYNGDTRVARSMRSKEEANDYRYFPCPDLLPVIIDDQYIDSLRRQLPELPDARQLRLSRQYELNAYDASILATDATVASFFEDVATHCKDGKLAANWVTGELTARLNSDNIDIRACPISGQQLGELIVRIKDNTISSKIAKQVFDALWIGEGANADAIIAARGYQQVSDSSAIEAIVAQVLADNAGQVAQYAAADEPRRKKMLGFFVGQTMKASGGQVNPSLVNEILMQQLNKD